MRKHLLLGALTAFGLTFSSQLFAQQKGHLNCGTAEALKKIYAENPQAEADFHALLERNKEVRVENGKKRQVYIIPIVFHILHQYGEENIPDANIYDQMEILNRDFRATNEDTADVINEFKALVGDAEIEFRLASKDPQGNCTNGIDHIYTNNAFGGDDFSKLNQWHRSRYLNVWVVGSIGSEGVAGYAYYPPATTGTSFWIDGIIILKEYVGSLLPAVPFRSRALTHEIGHYLSLPHTWGSTNDPEVACGDDGIEDTPITKGHDNCNNLLDDECTPGTIENVQNFMEYSYCSNMYTLDQVTVMRNTLLDTNNVGGRNNLIKDSIHAIVGADYDGDPQLRVPCLPEPDFNPDVFMACAGTPIKFNNFTWKGAATSFQWSFPGATTPTSTAVSPTVTYPEGGWYTVTLTATNATGSKTYTRENAVYVSPSWPEHIGPYSANFNNNTEFFITQNHGNPHSNWHRVTSGGRNGTPAYKLNNYKDVSNAIPFSDDYFYNQRMGGASDYLISPSYDVSTTTGVTVSFDYSYGSRTPELNAVTEKLILWSSRDCGRTWTQRKVIQKAELLSAGYVGGGDYTPTNENQWRTATYVYPAPTSLDKRLRFRIEYVSSDNSNNIYIDNFNVSGVLGVNDAESEISEMSMSPNPVSQGADLAVEIGSMTSEMTLQVVNMEGKIISTHYVSPVNGTQTVHIPMNVSKGVYMINASQGSARSTNRVIVF